MAQRWPWVALALWVLAPLVGCGSSSKQPPRQGTAGMPNVSGGGGSAGTSSSGGSPSAGGDSAGGEAGEEAQGGRLAQGGGGAGTSTTGGVGLIGVSGGGGMKSAVGGCPGTPDPSDSTLCKIPSNWSCDPALYYDGVCSCGCGVVDVDCADATSSACDSCPASSCQPFTCNVRPTNNAICVSAPLSWRCPSYLYADGDSCDCGCGFFDPDCAASDVGACDTCNAEGSCSAKACPGTIDPNQVGYCPDLDAPEGWTCDPDYYADGMKCDCGCGVLDLDCATGELDDCVRCFGCPSLECQRVDPSDTTLCLPAPEDWICDERRYGDTTCDCGCGVEDPNCLDLPGYCGQCPMEGCARGDCMLLDEQDQTQCNYRIPEEWSCEGAYFDGICDCGCGAIDRDCSSTSRDVCEVCDAPGSCSDQPCDSNEIDPDYNKLCVTP
jgi:hypothetical protein